MTDTGWRLPTGYTEVSGSPWTTPANIENETLNYASKTIAAKSTIYELAGTNFGFNTTVLPDDATITAVSLRVRWYQSTGTNANLGIVPYLDTTAGTEHIAQPVATSPRLDTFDITSERPGSGSWIPSDFRDGTLTVRLQARQANTANSRTYYFDYVEVQVSYTTPIVWDGAALFEGATDLEADAELPGKTWDGEALVEGIGAIAADADILHYIADAAAELIGLGGFEVDTTVTKTWDGGALLAGDGNLAIDATVAKIWDGAALFTGDGDLAVDGTFLAAGPPSFVQGRYDETGTVDSFGLSANTYTEFEFGLILDLGALGSGDTLDFRVFADGIELSNYVTPRITLSAGIQQQGAALYTGVGALGVNADVVHALWSGEARFVATGALAGDTRRFVAADSKFTAVGVFAADASVVHYVADGSALLSAAGSIAIDASVVHYVAPAAATFAGLGSFAADANRLINVIDISAKLTGAGAFAADAAVIHYIASAAALLAGAGSLDVSTTLLESGNALLAGAGALALDTVHTTDGAAKFTGAGELKADANRLVNVFDGSAKLDGTGAFAADAAVIHYIASGAALLAGAGSVAVDASVTHVLWQGAASFAGSGSLLAAANRLSVQIDASAALAGLGTFAVNGTVAHAVWPGAVLLAGAGSFVLDATTLHAVFDGAARFTGAGGLQANANRLTSAIEIAALFAGSGDITGQPATALLHFDTDYSDATGLHTWTPYGSPSIDTSQKKFGAASLHTADTADSGVHCSHADFLFSSGVPYTIEFFFQLNPSFIDSQNNLLTQDGSGGGNVIYVTGRNLRYWVTSDRITGADTITVGMHHCAISRDASNYVRLFLDGVQQGSAWLDNVFSSTGDIYVGGNGSGGWGLKGGWIDEVRILRGTALYTSNFTPPTSPYSIGGIDATVVHYVADGAARFAAAGGLAVDSRVAGKLQGAALLAGTGSLAVEAVKPGAPQEIKAKFLGVGGFLSAAVHRPQGATWFDARGRLIDGVTHTPVAAAKFTAQASMVAAAVRGPVPGAALFAAVANVRVNASVLHYAAPGNTEFDAAGALKVDTSILHWLAPAAARFTWQSYFLADGSVLHYAPSGATTVNWTGGLKANALLVHYLADGRALLAAAASLKSDGSILHAVLTDAATATFVGGLQVNADVVQYAAPGAAKLTGASSLAINTSIIHAVFNTAAEFDGAGGVHAKFALRGVVSARFHPIGNFKVDVTVLGVPFYPVYAAANFNGDGDLIVGAIQKIMPDVDLRGVVVGGANTKGVVGTQTDLRGTVVY